MKIGATAMYIYPDNLKAKATLWLWELRDIGVIGAGFLLSVFALARIGFPLPVVLTATYAFLTVRTGDVCILDFIRTACGFFFTEQQTYGWRPNSE
jgi:hypothetical protein